MSDFNNRMAAQRELLRIVNARQWPKEALYSLSSKSIERWLMVNGVDANSRLALLVVEASEKLFFLANRSQEQVTDDYKALSNELAALIQSIKTEMARAA
jgi:hypothetical protein